MNQVTKEQAYELIKLHQEIESAEKMLAVITPANASKEIPDFRDAFGRRRQLQLGVPSGENAHRIYDVPFDLAEVVVRAHRDGCVAKLAALNIQIRNQILTDSVRDNPL